MELRVVFSISDPIRLLLSNRLNHTMSQNTNALKNLMPFLDLLSTLKRCGSLAVNHPNLRMV